MPKTREELAEYQRQYRKKNPERINAINQRYRQKNPSKQPEWDLRARLKRLSIPPTRSMPDFCEICGRLPCVRRQGKEPTLFLDHDHATNAFRGWLCILCNYGLGAFGDSVADLEKAIAYLRRARDARAA